MFQLYGRNSVPCLKFDQITLGGVDPNKGAIKTNAFMIIIKAFLSNSCLTRLISPNRGLQEQDTVIEKIYSFRGIASA